MAGLEVAAGWKARHGLDAAASQADPLYGVENLFGTLGGDLNEADCGETLDSADDRSRNPCFVGNAADEVSGRDARVVSDIELDPDSGLVNPRRRAALMTSAR